MRQPDSSTLRLRCIRCGDLYQPETDDPYEHGICLPCFSKWVEMEPGSAAWVRFGQRLNRAAMGHPTYKALAAALDVLESVPHGSLDTSSA
jgi:recombinational DNA repair protein (RecF pathway)